jgi:hypothetical protein
MAKKLTGKKVRAMIEADKKDRIKRATERFWPWWHAQMDRDRLSPAEAALRAWLAHLR